MRSVFGREARFWPDRRNFALPGGPPAGSAWKARTHESAGSATNAACLTRRSNSRRHCSISLSSMGLPLVHPSQHVSDDQAEQLSIGYTIKLTSAHGLYRWIYGETLLTLSGRKGTAVAATEGLEAATHVIRAGLDSGRINGVPAPAEYRVPLRSFVCADFPASGSSWLLRRRLLNVVLSAA
jgi:hypothetical protein